MNKSDIDILFESYRTSILLLEVQITAANITRFKQKYGDISDEDVKKYIDSFNKIQQKLPTDKKDLFGSGFKDINDLNSAIERFSQIQSKTQQKQQVKIEGAEIILDNDHWLIVKPLTYEASCIYGSGTKWCTAGKHPNYFNSYVKDQHKILYYIIDKTKTRQTDPLYHKMAVSVDTDNKINVIYNAQDKTIKIQDFIKITGFTDLSIFKNEYYKKLYIPENYTKDQLIEWCKTILNLTPDQYKINDDLSLDVYKEVFLANLGLNKIPIKFNYVKGYFNCYDNNLKTLENTPKKVDGSFDCSVNKLITLKGGPEWVSGDFNCSYNDLTTLEYKPKYIGKQFYYDHNDNLDIYKMPEKYTKDQLINWCKDALNLTPEQYKINNDLSLDVYKDVYLAWKMSKIPVAFNIIKGNFWCDSVGLKTLENAPKVVNGDFSCSYNELITLKGSPQKISGSFRCHGNKLKTLEGCPQEIKKRFDCGENKYLTSLKGGPKRVEGSCHYGGISITSFEYAPKYIGNEVNIGYIATLTSLIGLPNEVRALYLWNLPKLQNLQGCPQKINKSFSIYYGLPKVTTLEGGPQIVGSCFNCCSKAIISLKGGPKEVGRNFNCSKTQIQNLQGCPKIVGRNFYCRAAKITSLKGCPQIINGTFDCSGNKLTDLKYAPKHVIGNFSAIRNPLKDKTIYSKVDGIIKV